MSDNPPYNELFFPKLETAKKDDALLKAACLKIEGKLDKYALSRGISKDELRLFDVCDPDGDLHPRLRRHIEKIPKLDKQTDARYKKYKEEICANVKRAIDAVLVLITGKVRNGPARKDKEQVAVLLCQGHPVLNELYGLLPRERIRDPANRARFRRGHNITENGCLFYLACAEALKHCSASSLHEFLSEYRPFISRAYKVVCPSTPEKIVSLQSLLPKVCKEVGVAIPSKRKRVPVEKWPSPIREEMRVYLDAAEGRLIEGLEEQLGRADVVIKISNNIRPATVRGVESTVELLLYRYFQGRERVSLRDMLSTTASEINGADGKKGIEYFNAVLCPYRESERARSDEAKRVGYDSQSFGHAVKYLLSLAAYNGIFEYHEIIRKAFKIKLDVERIEQRKAEKKSIIKRKVLDDWIEDNWPEYERILTGGLFKRDKSKRSHVEADRNMRFVLHYCRMTTMKVMGYRQRQIRDCLDGVNLVVTADSLEFTYPADKTKKAKPLHFEADLENCGKTHGRLIQALYLFHRHAFPYVQVNLKQCAPEDGRRIDSRGQFFVHFSRCGEFIAFDQADNKMFSRVFKEDCRRFLKHPDLQSEALHLINPHYMRGASMDTQIEDKGMSMRAASRYFGATEQVIRSKYKDRNAIQDASRDVVLLNAQIEDLEERKRRNRGEGRQGGVGGDSEAEVQVLRRRLRESQERERQKDERIAKLEERLDKRHDEIMEALHGGGNGRADREVRSKRKSV